MEKNYLKREHAMIGHKLDTTTPKTSVQCSAKVRKINRVLITIKKEKQEQKQNTHQKKIKTLCDIVNPNTHKSFTLSAALFTSLKESRVSRKAQESSGI